MSFSLSKLQGKRMGAGSVERDDGEVHIPNINGSHTLCGWTDTGTRWTITDDPIDCRACLEIWDFVKKSSIERKRTKKAAKKTP